MPQRRMTPSKGLRVKGIPETVYRFQWPTIPAIGKDSRPPEKYILSLDNLPLDNRRDRGPSRLMLRSESSTIFFELEALSYVGRLRSDAP